MDSGYYAACAGLAAQMQSLELLGNNLANLLTTGYRGEQTTFRSILTGRDTVGWNAINVAVNDYGVLSGSLISPREAWRQRAIPWMCRSRAKDFSWCSPGRKRATRATAAFTFRRRGNW